MAEPFDTSHEGTDWIAGDGGRYFEVRRINDGNGNLSEVQLSPVGTPALRGWYNATEITEQGLVEASS